MVQGSADLSTGTTFVIIHHFTVGQSSQVGSVREKTKEILNLVWGRVVLCAEPTAVGGVVCGW